MLQSLFIMKIQFCEAVDSMAKEIIFVVKHYLDKLVFDSEGMIAGKNADGTYQVMINKQKYNVKNGTNIELIPGNKCLVHYINGKENKKVIIAKL